MKNQNPPFTITLISYYGLIQAAHIVALVRSHALFMQSGEITFLAQPPPGGCAAQVQYFLIGLGAIEFVTAILALAFVYGYLNDLSYVRSYAVE